MKHSPSSSSVRERKVRQYSALLVFVFVVIAAVPQDSFGKRTQNAGSDSLRIRIFDLYSPKTLHVSAEGGMTIVTTDGEVVQSAEEPAVVEIENRSTVRLAFADATKLSPQFTIRAIDGGAIVAYVNGNPKPTRKYSGTVQVRVDPKNQRELLLVNTVPVEDYVAAVVATEYGLDDVEGSRAMAVLARTYALRSKAGSGNDYDHVDHSMSQVFHGVGTIDYQSNEAANSTLGQVLVHNGELVESVYHSSSGGHTANNEDVWNGSPVAYLRGRVDRYEDSPHKDWRVRVDRERLLRVLSNHLQIAVSGLTVDSRSDDGRVDKLLLKTASGDREMPANDFRLVFRREFGTTALKSTLFRVRRRGSEYHFEGSGFGHGVGLSQWGAHRMAQAGKSYDEILRYYYSDVDLVSLGGIVTSDRLPPLKVTEKSTKESVETRGKAPARPRRGW